MVRDLSDQFAGIDERQEQSAMPGSVTKWGKSWTVRHERGVDPITGKRRQASRDGFRTRREAEAVLTKLLRERDLGTDLDSTRLTVGVPAVLARYRRDAPGALDDGDELPPADRARNSPLVDSVRRELCQVPAAATMDP